MQTVNISNHSEISVLDVFTKQEWGWEVSLIEVSLHTFHA